MEMQQVFSNSKPVLWRLLFYRLRFPGNDFPFNV